MNKMFPNDKPMTQEKALTPSLIDRLNVWIEGVNKVQDENIPLNGNGLKAILAEAAAALSAAQEEIRRLGEEREGCAKVCDQIARSYGQQMQTPYARGAENAAWECADAIRKQNG